MLLMFIYLSKIKKIDDRKKVRIFIIFTSIIFILDSALRNLGVGPDTYHYYYLFNSMEDYSFAGLFNRVRLGGRDFFFYIIMKCFYSIYPRYHVFLGFVALVFFSSLGIYLYRNKIGLLNIFLAYTFYLLFFYNFFSVTGTRQTLAVSFVMLAYLVIDKKVLCVGLIIFASFIHFSAIVALATLFFKPLKELGVVLFLVPFVLPFAFQFRNQISQWFVSDTVFSERFSFYTQETGAGSLYVTSIYMLVLIGMYIYYNEMAATKENAFNMKLFTLCIFTLPLMWMSNTAFRISLYFSMSMYILIPVIVQNIKFQGRYVIAFLTILALIFLIYQKSEPYHFYWQEMVKFDSEGYPVLLVEPLY